MYEISVCIYREFKLKEGNTWLNKKSNLRINVTLRRNRVTIIAVEKQ
jgi:hypothetical protein